MNTTYPARRDHRFAFSIGTALERQEEKSAVVASGHGEGRRD